ncbi:Hydroxyacylglutathione hydrolase GloB [Pseudoalteromonas holothuriae]|uniref:Hydroxyacylglutathione hydrolase n=1 Tax=Pseudoalteromonas holothuriae TaxID=2963714 RepID=A0A9W4R368_9GAMM|nr:MULTISPECIES: hydroxyacylglutathione hydrolase [unclassified Pseudoalteromonas]CAH9063932.1 Hydroxyacylglutathione hydrolase GloB [Pseudoalteromonas sp. CIP111951]CAH9065025.1 Hydroxyacylglutathione hydrolase GloB [Pseudoalteromonas sp. CIP111854]
MVQVKPIKAFDDNYIWAIHDTTQKQVWVVDPGQAEPVVKFLNDNQASLQGILVTHHHWDHTTGIASLKEITPQLRVFGPANSPYNGITDPLYEGDTITVFNIELAVIETPGHTLDHICYLNHKLCFTGDTLFSAGCGRLMEGNAEQMWQSLKKFTPLKDETLMYCTHEYTMANLAFASAVEPDNQDISEYKQWAASRRSNNLPTLPSTFGKERAVNPFLRANLSHISEYIPKHIKSNLSEPWQVFAALRVWKDKF